MEPQESNSVSSQDKGLALVCHLSMFFGAFIVPLIIYFIQKGKSRFVAFNALEAVYFHLLYMIVSVLAIVVMVVGIGVGTTDTRVDGGGAKPPVAFVIAFFAVFFAIVLFFVINAIIAAVKSYQGQIKKYPIVGGIAYNQTYNS
jgi:uncharacterized Tic20 family protein